MFILYFFIWIVFSMRLDLEIAVIGALLSAWVYRFACKHMGYSLETDRKIVKKFILGAEYVLVLVAQTAKSNIEVSRLVFAKKIEVEPRIIYLKTDLKSEAMRVALANSITLTPGTITVSLSGDQLCVHCINSKMAEELQDSIFIRKLRRMEEL